MPSQYQHIVLVLFTSHESQLSVPGASRYTGRACIAGDSWASNLVSLLSGSVPSHHQVWSEASKIGIHVDTLPTTFKQVGYRTTFLGLRESESLAKQCKFDEVAITSDGDGARDVTALVDRAGDAPLFATCLVPSFSEGWQALVTRLASSKEHPAIVLLAGLVSPARAADAVILGQDAISSPYTLLHNKIGKHIDGSTQLWSIIDLAPSLLGLAGIKVPYTMVGKDLHPYWLGKPRKAIAFPRDRCLVEHADGSKTTWNGRYLLTVHPGKDVGELIDAGHREGDDRNLWDDPAAAPVKSRLLLELLWAQLDKECMPMPRIAGA
jgi:hypothetical protein